MFSEKLKSHYGTQKTCDTEECTDHAAGNGARCLDGSTFPHITVADSKLNNLNKKEDSTTPRNNWFELIWQT